MIDPSDPAVSLPSLRDDCGLSIDMLDADRLRSWANLLDIHGNDISHWAQRDFVIAKLREIATGIEQAVRDIGELRNRLDALLAVASTPASVGVRKATPYIPASFEQEWLESGEYAALQRTEAAERELAQLKAAASPPPRDTDDDGDTRQSSSVPVTTTGSPRQQPDASAQGWRSIATAPKDGTTVIVWPLRIFAAFDLRFGFWIADDDGCKVTPTHWYPAPEPPTVER